MPVVVFFNRQVGTFLDFGSYQKTSNLPRSAKLFFRQARHLFAFCKLFYSNVVVQDSVGHQVQKNLKVVPSGDRQSVSSVGLQDNIVLVPFEIIEYVTQKRRRSSPPHRGSSSMYRLPEVGSHPLKLGCFWSKDTWGLAMILRVSKPHTRSRFSYARFCLITPLAG